MNESSIKPIGSVRAPESGTPSRPLVATQAETMPTQKPGTLGSNPNVRQTELHSEATENVSNVSIHFRLDEKTNELTVFVVDRQTKRVLRSIPASELQKLQAGDLLKLTA